MAFRRTMDLLAPDRSIEMVLDGKCSKTLDADAVIEKLGQAGYTKAKICRGGIDAWREAGFPMGGNGISFSAAPAEGVYSLDPNLSPIRWTGRNLFNHHEGTLKLSNGSASVGGGEVSEAAFTIDMNSITCGDIPDSQMNGMLISHLKSDDFFSVDEFPFATFVTRSLAAITGATPGCTNWTITGDLTLRGVTAEVTFPAVIAMKPKGVLVAQAEFFIGRTRWGAVYGSGKFFARLAHHVVDDDVQPHLKL